MNKDYLTTAILERFEELNPHTRVIDIFTNDIGYWVVKFDVSIQVGTSLVTYHGIEIVLGNHRNDIIRAYKPDKPSTRDK